MNMENLMSGAFGALFVTVFDFVLLRKQNKLEDRLNLVEDEKITQLERKINKHLEADRSQEILTEAYCLADVAFVHLDILIENSPSLGSIGIPILVKALYTVNDGLGSGGTNLDRNLGFLVLRNACFAHSAQQFFCSRLTGLHIIGQ